MEKLVRSFNNKVSRRKFLLACGGGLTATLSGCVGDGDDNTESDDSDSETPKESNDSDSGTPKESNDSDSETPEDSENLNDPDRVIEEYIERFYAADIDWVNDFYADDGKKEQLSSSDAESLEQIDVNIEEIVVVEESDTEAIVQAKIELIAEDATATTTIEFELRQIDGEWKLWDSEEMQEGLNVSEIDFAYPEFGSGIETIVTIENQTDERIDVNVVVEIYDENLLVDDTSMWVEIPPETTVREDRSLSDVEDPERVTHYIVKGKIGYGGELSTIFEHDGELLREALEE